MGVWRKHVAHIAREGMGRYETQNWLSLTQSVVGQEQYGEIWYKDSWVWEIQHGWN